MSKQTTNDETVSGRRRDHVPLKIAEDAIQRILIHLEDHSGRNIETVRVDTRRLANLAVEIIFEERNQDRQ